MGGSSSTISTSETRIEALTLQSSAYGVTIPLVYGVNRIAGNMLWYGDFKANAHTSSQTSGGKGGGGGGGVTQVSTTYTYSASVMMGLCEGPISAIPRIWKAKKLYVGSPSAASQLSMSIAAGLNGQATWPYLSSSFPAQAIGYSGLAHVYAQDYDLGASASIENHSFEISGQLAYSGGYGAPDANTALVAVDVLTNPRYGASFPAGQMATAGWSTYCLASNILLSPALTEQMQAGEFVAKICALTNTGPVWSGNQLKMIPYGDTVISGNGATYTPNITPLYDLTDDDFTPSEGSDPIRVKRKPQADAYNHIRVEFVNRANYYNVEITEAKDSANIDAYGLRSAEIVSAHWICDADIARTVAQLLLQRAMYIRNTYEFDLPWTRALLEPMDLVTLTDAGLGYNKLAVRITEIGESDSGDLTVVAEDFPVGVAHAALYPSQAGTGFQHDYNAAPGSILVPMFFEAPVERTTTGLEIYSAVRGIGSHWGGCRVWTSYDGVQYKDSGLIYGGARYGMLTGPIAGGSLPVALNGGQLLSGSATDSANLATLCYIGGANPEYLAHGTATLTGANAYTLVGLTRSAFTTSSAAHSTGAAFARVDDALAKSGPLDLAMIGKTIYFKFTSFNVYKAAEESLANVTAYPYVVTGAMAALPPPSVTSFTIDGIKLTWLPVVAMDLAGYRIKYQYGSNTEWGTANPLHTGLITDSPYSMLAVPPGQITIMVRAVDTTGNESLVSAYVITNMGNALVANVLESKDFKAAGWPGSLTNATVLSGNLQATQSDVFYKAPESNFYGPAGAPFYGSKFDAMEWISSGFTPSAAAVGSKLTIAWALTGDAVKVQYRPTGPSLFYKDPQSVFYGDPAAPFYDPPPAWMPWPGSIVATNQQYQWRFTTAAGPTPGVVSAFTASVDVPDKNLKLGGVSIAAGGTRLTGAIGLFNVIQNIQLTLQGGSTAVLLEIQDYSTTLGPLITAKNSAGTGVTATIDALLQGY